MKIKLFFFLGIFMFAGVLTNAQTLSPTVISSSGGFFTAASGSLSFTVAEMTMVQTFTGTSNILTQGFQQPEDFSVSITESELPAGEVVIYPNPTSGQFSLAFNASDDRSRTIKIYNLVGQVVYSEMISPVKGINTTQFDISSLSQGVYMLEISGTAKKDHSVHKINLVY